MADARRASELEPTFIKAWLRLGDGLVLAKEGGDWQARAREACQSLSHLFAPPGDRSVTDALRARILADVKGEKLLPTEGAAVMRKGERLSSAPLCGV